MIPIFKSHYSYGRSILTIEDEKEIKDGQPVSIVAICATHNLKEVYLAETSMGGFYKSHKVFAKNNINLRFGYQVVCCRDIYDKTEESKLTESKVIVWLRDGGGYADLCRFYTKCNTDGFYYTGRCDYKMLEDLSPDLLEVSIPFYDSFIHNNILESHRCTPEFGNRQLSFHIEDHNLPFDPIIKNGVLKYIGGSAHKIIDSHSVYYYNNDDINAYQVFRCINNRSKFTKPDLNHFGSDEFSFESYLDKIK